MHKCVLTGPDTSDLRQTHTARQKPLLWLEEVKGDNDIFKRLQLKHRVIHSGVTQFCIHALPDAATKPVSASFSSLLI